MFLSLSAMSRFLLPAAVQLPVTLSLSLLIAAAVSGCASSPPSPSVASAPAVATPVASPASAAVPAPLVSTVPPAADLEPQALPGISDPDSYAWRADARELAKAIALTQELDPQWVWSALASARRKETVARLMMPPPSGVAKNWVLYRSRFVEPIRIRAGVAFWRQYQADLLRAEQRYGVPAHIIAGVIGVETIYGRQTGNFRVLDALATLSLDFPKGRTDRSGFFRDELGQFLKLCQEQRLNPVAVQGSYAGAIGWPQFMPSSIRRWGVDFDGDGRVDLQGSPVDAIGSVAHYLAEHGWEKDRPSYYDVTPPQDPQALDKLLGPDILPSFSADEMQALGAKLPDAALNQPGKLALVKLENGANAPTLIVGTGNFYAITRYNQSSYYALAVIQLGEAVAREVNRQMTPP